MGKALVILAIGVILIGSILFIADHPSRACALYIPIVPRDRVGQLFRDSGNKC